MPFDDDLVDVARLVSIEAAQAEVVDDEQIGREQAAYGLLPGVIGLCLVEFSEHLIGAQEEDLMARATGCMTETAREQGLAHSNGAEEEDVFGPLQEAEVEEIADPIPIEGDGSIPVEVFEGTDLPEARPLEPGSEIALLAAVDLILEDQLQEVLGSQVDFLRIGHAIGECVQDPRELQTLEYSFE